MLVNAHKSNHFRTYLFLILRHDPKLMENYEHNQIIKCSNMVNACVPKKSPDICLREIQFGIKLALAFYS